MGYLECKQESLSMWDQDMEVVYTEKFVSYRHRGEKLANGKDGKMVKW